MFVMDPNICGYQGHRDHMITGKRKRIGMECCKQYRASPRVTTSFCGSVNGVLHLQNEGPGFESPETRVNCNLCLTVRVSIF